MSQPTQQSGADSNAAPRANGLDVLLGRAAESGPDEETSGGEEEALSSDDTSTEADAEPEKPKAAAKQDAEDPLLKELGVSAEWAKENAEILDKLRARLAPAEAKSSEPDTNQVIKDLMAELESKGKPEEQPKKEDAKPEQTAQPQQFKFGDLGDSWNTYEDGYKARSEADLAGDFGKLNQIDDAIFSRRFMGAMPGLTQYVNRLIEQAIGKHVPSGILHETERFRDERLDREGREKAEQMLAGKLGDSFAEMLREDGGKEVLVEGQALSPVPYNRIVAEHPHIAEIRRTHQDPEKAAVLTWMARFAAAHSIHKIKQAQAKDLSQAAKTMAEASAKSAVRTERERARNAAHAGGRSNGTFEGSKPKGQDDDQELITHIRDNSPGAAVRRLRSM